MTNEELESWLLLRFGSLETARKRAQIANFQTEGQIEAAVKKILEDFTQEE